jgi:Eco57I restriction-modification methylase
VSRFLSITRHPVPLLDAALAVEHEKSNPKDDTIELAVIAQGISKAAELLGSKFTLVATNVPYLGRGKQVDLLQEFCEDNHPEAKADLCTCFVDRCMQFTGPSSSIAVVTPQNWLFLATYRSFRKSLTKVRSWDLVTRLGPNAFQDMNWWHATTALVVLSSHAPMTGHTVHGLDVSKHKDQSHKAILLRGGSVNGDRSDVQSVPQSTISADPEVRIVIRESDAGEKLSDYAVPHTGMQTGDNDHYSFVFWELPQRTKEWEFFHRTSVSTCHYSGRSLLLRWENGRGALAIEPGRRIAGLDCLGHSGILVHRMNQLPVTIYTGEIFDQNGAVILTNSVQDLVAAWCFLSSDSYKQEVRCLDTKTGVTPKTLAAVPFNAAYWQGVAAEKYPLGLAEALFQ